MKSVLKQALSVILVILIAAIKVNAQETTAEIQGLITVGKTGVAGASITVIHQPTGTKYVTTSRTDGRYNLTNLKIGGPYTLEVSYVGSKTEKQDDINLLLGQTFKANFNLKEASSSLKDVVVTSNKQDKVFNNARTGSQETFNRNQIISLPTISRSYKDIIKLTPTYNSGSFAGQSSQLNNITIDGANFNNSFGLSGDIGGQTGQNAVSLDAIEQIQVNTSPFDVKNGGFVGGGVNSVSRSGTNTYSGSVYQYLKNKNWQGYEVNAAPYNVKIPKQDYSYDLKGFTAGGAIIKNKLFIFVNGEQESNTTPGTTWTASTASNPANNSTISAANADSLNKLASFLKSKYNYDPGAYQGYSYVASSKRLTIKLDWNINANNTFTFKYNYLKSANQIPPSNSGSVSTRQAGTSALPFFGAGYEINNNAKVFIAELNSKISNRMSNKLQIGYSALRDYRKALTSNVNFPMVDILDGNGKPFTSFGHELYTYGNKLNTDVYQFNDNLTFYAGKHEITLGTQTSFKKYLNGFSPDYQGVYRFANLNDFINSANGLGTKPLQYRISYTLGDGPFPLVGPKDFESGVYAQDKYRASDKLTITYGIRFDYTKFYNTFLYNPVVDTLKQFYNGIHANTGAAPNMAVQISPRIGFNYDVYGDQTLQIRGGAGLFQGAPPFVWVSNQASNSGMALFGSFTQTNTSTPTSPDFSPDVNAYRPAASASLSKSYSINVTDPNYKFPQVFKSTLAADKKLGNGWIVTAEGTYIKQINASVFQNIALPSSGLVRLSDGRMRFPKTSNYPQAGVVNSANNPSIGNAIYMTNSSAGYAWTGTLQVQKITKNFILTAAYTRQEAKDAAVSGSTAATMWGSKVTSENPNDFTIGNSNNYMPHRIIASVVYKKEFIKDQVTSVGMVYEASPNYATSYYVQNDVNGDGIPYNDLMYVPEFQSQIKLTNAAAVNGIADTRNQDELWNQLNNFINNNSYLNSRRGQFAERNGFVLPWTHRLDLNFTQDVKFTVGKNKHTFRFTADIYNLTNLLNKDWGVYYIPTTTTPLVYSKIDADGKTPVYTFPYLDGANRIPYSVAHKPSTGLGSRYQIQLGVRYLFN